jgi:P27 family predicted phage terminase small subunit
MRGRKPQPTRRRELDGNPGKRALNPNEPTPDAPSDAFDVPPPELEGQTRAADEWRRLAPILRRSRQVTEVDRAALIALCVEWGRYLDAQVKLLKTGMVVTTASGYPLPNPYLAIANKALQGCTRLWAELGMTPSSRSRVQLPPDASDPFAEFDVPQTEDVRRH